MIKIYLYIPLNWKQCLFLFFEQKPYTLFQILKTKNLQQNSQNKSIAPRKVVKKYNIVFKKKIAKLHIQAAYDA